MLQAVEHIDVGVLHVNSESAGADPHVPFGGAKKSGLGPKEQGGAAREFFTHTTTVYLRGGKPARMTPGALRRRRRRRLQPGAGRAVRHDDARRLRRRGHQDRTPAASATTPANGGRPTILPAWQRISTSVNRNKRSRRAGPHRSRPTTARPRAGRHRRHRGGELPARDHGEARARLRAMLAPTAGPRSTARSPDSAAARGAALPGYDLLVQAVGGLMSVTGPARVNPPRSASHSSTCSPACTRWSGSWPRWPTGTAPAGPARRHRPALSCCCRHWSIRHPATWAPARCPASWATATRACAISDLPTADRPIALAVGNDKQFTALTTVIGLPDLEKIRDSRRTPCASRTGSVRLARTGVAGRGADHWYAALAGRRRAGRADQRPVGGLRLRPPTRDRHDRARAGQPDASGREPGVVVGHTGDLPQRSARPRRCRSRHDRP